LKALNVKVTVVQVLETRADHCPPNASTDLELYCKEHHRQYQQALVSSVALDDGALIYEFDQV
jgi:hypothetical protein